MLALTAGTAGPAAKAQGGAPASPETRSAQRTDPAAPESRPARRIDSAGARASATAPSSFTWGGDVRLRNEYFDNALTLSDAVAGHEQDYFRTRARLWFSGRLTPGVSANLRIAAEPRTWLKDSFAKQHPGTGTEWRYGIVDALNLKFATDVAGNPLTVTIGRQDILFADFANSWLVVEGSPGDGSWTLFFDAVRLSLDLKGAKTKIDLVALDNQARPGDRLPLLGSKSTYSLLEQDEQGLILNASSRMVPGTQLDAYAIYKRDRRVLASGDNADLCTIGGKIAGQLYPNLQYAIEAALQRGTKQDPGVKTPVAANVARRDVAAYGAVGRLSYSLKDRLANQFSLCGELLSGDKPGTAGRDEMFDILWGRYPRFSEGYLFPYVTENGGKIAQLGNLLRVSPGWSCTPAKDTGLSLIYSLLLADEAVPTRVTNPRLYGGGRVRGNLAQLIVKRQFTKTLGGHVWLEFMKLGSFYSSRDTLSFIRFELSSTF